MSTVFTTEERPWSEEPGRFIAPPEEQEVCIVCGYCCDGTLFSQAALTPGERGSLPAKIGLNIISCGKEDCFRLPCEYFEGSCSIYDSPRAEVCSRYRCQLLIDLAGGKISVEDAKRVVGEARLLRDNILHQFSLMNGADHKLLHFRQVLTELGKMQKWAEDNDESTLEIEILIARCNIFEALLIKHFRSSGDFSKMTEHE